MAGPAYRIHVGGLNGSDPKSLRKPPKGKTYLVTDKAMGDLKDDLTGLMKLEMGAGLKLIKGEKIWKIELDVINAADGQAGSGSLAWKDVTICEDDSPVTYTFLVRL